MPLQLRGSNYHLRRRVPKRYARVESRTVVYVSLATDSLSEAREKEPQVWNQLLAQWEALLKGDTSQAEERYEAAKEIAKSYNVRFMPAEKIAQLPPRELLDRVQMSMNVKGEIDDRKAAGILGTAKKPRLTVSKALEIFWQLTKPEVSAKSEDQLRRWKNPRLRAFAHFQEVNGDVVLEDLASDHMLAFREWLWERIEVGEIKENSANKDLTHFGSVLKKVNQMRSLGLDLPVKGWMFTEKDKETRLPYSTDWIKAHFIDTDHLDGLNDQARGILRAMINTGARLGEIANLMPEDISLDGKVPFIHIRPSDNREIKNKNSRRVIPLAGISLRALETHAQGFPRYRDKPTASATINKYLRERGLQETPKHTLYGLRHAFEDRMLEAGIDERVRRDILGHALNRERYGEGGRMEFRLAQVQRVAL